MDTAGGRPIALVMVAVSMMATLSCSQAGPASQSPPTGPADTIYIGGDIVTVNDAQPAAEALAVRDGKIVAVGARGDVEKAHKGAATQVVDLGGKTLMPGFIDAHGHYINALTVANQVNLYAPPAGPGTDPDAIVRQLLIFKDEKKVATGELIQAYGYDENVMPKGNLLNRDHLDKAFPDNPVVVGPRLHARCRAQFARAREVRILGRLQDAARRRRRPEAGQQRALRVDHGDGVPSRRRQRPAPS